MTKFNVIYLGNECVEIEIISTRKESIERISKEIFSNSFTYTKELNEKLNLIIDVGYGNKIDEISLSKLYKRIFSLL